MRYPGVLRSIGMMCLVLAPLLATAGGVTGDRLARGTDDGRSWLMYGGNYHNWRYSPLKDITAGNVKKLAAAWMFQTGIPGQLEAAPIVADGVLYLTASYNHLFAMDAVTGAPLWKYEYPLPGDIRICCGPTNRGVAIAGDRVYMATLDAHLVALDRHTGKELWNIAMDDYKAGYSATAAPLVVKDMVIIGVACGEYGARGFIDAYDVATGARKWRHWTVPAAGEPGVETWAGDSWKTGGGPAWATGAYDPKADVIYWAVGNPSPDWNGDTRLGDNLYTNSILALDPATGNRKWHFQTTPHDVWDYDGNTGFFLIDQKHDGKPVETLVQPNRNGWLYVLDRADGRFLQGTQYVDKLNWATGLDPKGRPIFDPKYVPQTGGNADYICPGNVGGTNGAFTAAYSPDTKLLYVPVIESCGRMEKGDVAYSKGDPFWAGGPGKMHAGTKDAYGHLSALDPATGKEKWRYRDEYPFAGGTLATAGGVVFTGNQQGYALALDAKSGKVLWRFQTGAAVRGQPVTYRIQGRQYVAVGSGGGGIAIALVGEPPLANPGSALVVFALPE
ncbi:MAG: PQQ-dependent dehydrogenase, methanol/ethanol family [Gammaproteobacteria bacterium]|nr:PQQ-dependent dehydrogenase, methanol/ethanol family [Gammaproteobacteria bacterium]